MCEKQDIAILGGTFNPIHNGHIHAAKTVLKALRPDMVLFIPAGVPPHKEVEENGQELKKHRYLMTKLAIEEDNQLEICDIELNKNEKCYTIDTLLELKTRCNPKHLSLIIGTDMFLSFEKWKSYDKILEICSIVVLPRFDDNMELLYEKYHGFAKHQQKKITMIEANIIEISSTQIRDMVRQGKDIGGLVPPKVAEYIKEQKLYLL